MGDALRLALGTLTAVPVPPPRDVGRAVAGRAMVGAPLTTFPALIVLGLWGWAVLTLTASSLVAAGIAVTVLTLLTRAMHLDGLADTADGLSASYDRARGLEVMRRSDIGPSGVAAVVLVLVVEFAALATLFAGWPALVLGATALVSSRQVLAWACVRGVPAARPEGLGATVAESVPRALAGGTTLALLLLAGAASLAVGEDWWRGPVVVATALLAGAAVIRRTVRRFGGITGDVLGATVEISFAASVTVAALLAT
jgi:adenosylcobinamide-GDP ribazoletransferase